MFMTPEERIGNYRVHPAAALFPLLADDDTDFDALKSSILERGQLLPILVQGDVLLDGRNHLRACLAVGVKPRIEEYSGPLTGSELISELNLSRRDLEPEERAIITGKIFVMIQRERKGLAQKAAGTRGIEGGRGHKKTPDQNSGPGFIQEKHARSTVGQVAAKAGVSRHVAEQAVFLITRAPELAEQVQHGRMKLREAAKQARARVPAKRKVAKVAEERKPSKATPAAETKPAAKPPQPDHDTFSLSEAVEKIKSTIQYLKRSRDHEDREKLAGRLYKALLSELDYRPADRRSKAQRWQDAVDELKGLQNEYQMMLDSLPVNLQNGTRAEKLQAVMDIDLSELEGADLP
jgi:hypothetical protein